MVERVIPPEKYLEIYASMYYTKRLEKTIWDLRMLLGAESPVKGAVLNSWWEWAIGAGVAAALDPNIDYLVPGHRVTSALANFFIRSKQNFALPYFRNHLAARGSPTLGWALNVHYGFPDLHIFPFHSDMAANLPAAAGIGLALRRLHDTPSGVQKKQGVVMASFGEGAFNQGLAHEGLSFIGTQNLPVIVVIDKNNWSTYTPYSEEVSIEDLSDRALAYGLAKLEIKLGYDAVLIYRKVAELVDRAREESQRPKSLYDTKAGALVVIEMERGAPHNVQMDTRQSFRTYERHQVYAENLARDAVAFLRRQLLSLPKLKAVQAQGDLRKVAELGGEDMEFEEKTIVALEREIDREIEESLETVKKESPADYSSAARPPWPKSKYVVAFPRGASREVEPPESYWRGRLSRAEAQQKGWTTKFVDARRRVVDREFTLSPRLHAWGEDYGQGDVYGQWKCPYPDAGTLQEKYGKARIFNSILAEGAIYGSAEGAAFAGLRPVVGVQYLQFGFSGVSALVSGVAPRFQIYGLPSPITICMPSAEGITAGHHHGALHLKTLLYHLQMVKVVEPATVRDMAGLLRSALRDNAPVVVIEGISAYENVLGLMPEGDDFTVPIGKAALRQEGKDLTILSWGAWVTWNVVMPALDALAERSISAEWIDARTLVPMDYSLILDSVAKTGRLIVVQAEGITGSIGESVIAKVVTDSVIRSLDPPVCLMLVGASDGAAPQAPLMESVYLPSVNKLLAACFSLLEENEKRDALRA